MFDIKFWTRIIIDVIILGFISVGFGSWLNYKYGKKLQELQPLTAEQILRKENYLNSKKDVFFESIGLINRRFASSEWNGHKCQKTEQ